MGGPFPQKLVTFFSEENGVDMLHPYSIIYQCMEQRGGEINTPRALKIGSLNVCGCRAAEKMEEIGRMFESNQPA